MANKSGVEYENFTKYGAAIERTMASNKTLPPSIQ